MTLCARRWEQTQEVGNRRKEHTPRAKESVWEPASFYRGLSARCGLGRCDLGRCPRPMGSAGLQPAAVGPLWPGALPQAMGSAGLQPAAVGPLWPGALPQVMGRSRRWRWGSFGLTQTL